VRVYSVRRDSQSNYQWSFIGISIPATVKFTKESIRAKRFDYYAIIILSSLHKILWNPTYIAY